MEDKTLKDEETSQANGGSAKILREFRGGYCPYTTDRVCRMEIVGHFDPENEECVTCGWRAW